MTYYSSHSGRVYKPIPALNHPKIYHDYPFDSLFDMEGENWKHKGYDPTLTVKESVIETAIVFAFLFTGRLYKIDNVKGVDMLNLFKFACANFHSNTVEVKAESPLRDRFHTMEASNSYSHEQTHPALATSNQWKDFRYMRDSPHTMKDQRLSIDQNAKTSRSDPSRKYMELRTLRQLTDKYL